MNTEWSKTFRLSFYPFIDEGIRVVFWSEKNTWTSPLRRPSSSLSLPHSRESPQCHLNAPDLTSFSRPTRDVFFIQFFFDTDVSRETWSRSSDNLGLLTTPPPTVTPSIEYKIFLVNPTLQLLINFLHSAIESSSPFYQPSYSSVTLKLSPSSYHYPCSPT